ncbi:N-acetylmuramic acid 6-phosphate phosphatase [Halomonadaceae bacterium LMG 33818]|uniref:HAD family hydrolase n=1 Tax=Cernens ardua TaxID=3402176 RepID=UPI003EDBF3FD
MKAVKHYSAILFDLDGTLVDTAPDLVAATNTLRQERGHTPLDYTVVRAVVSQGGAALTRLALGEAATSQDHARLLSLYEKLLGENSQPYEGLAECVKRLMSNGIRWGIVTNKERRFAEPLLSRLELFPEVLICGDDLPCAKPDPRPLIMAMEQLNLPVESGLYIGDHLRDIEAAKRAEMDSIAAGYGYLMQDENPCDWDATKTVCSPAELAGFLLSLYESRQGA